MFEKLSQICFSGNAQRGTSAEKEYWEFGFGGGWNLPEVLGQKLKDFSRREFPTFNSREEALAWLVEE